MRPRRSWRNGRRMRRWRLLRMHQPAKVWPLLKHGPDPTLRSYLIHRLGPLGADAGAILKQLDSESDITIRRALILSLGEYGERELSLETRKALLPKLQAMYRIERRSGASCGTGMAVAKLEAGGMAETGERGLGQEPGAAREATHTASSSRSRRKKRRPHPSGTSTVRDRRWW